METLATMDEQTMAKYFTRKLSQPIYINTQSFPDIVIILFLRITFKFYLFKKRHVYILSVKIVAIVYVK